MNSKLIQGDCLEKLKELPDNSVDLIVTDPPYGYSFMGKDWDKALPSVEIWKECFRVLKAGGFAYVMSAPRQDVLARMMINLEDSGFNTNFTSMYWAYATGFPKAMNISKAVDKKLGVEREVVGRNPNSRENCDKTNTIYESGTVGKTDFITKPTSDKAKKLNGSYAGYQPKPAVEVIIVCMKPLSEKTYLEQAMKDGKGVSWFDDCRIPTSKSDKYDLEQREISKAHGIQNDDSFLDQIHDADAKHGVQEQGRFPANLIVSDDALNSGESGKTKGTKRKPRDESSVFKNSGFKNENNNTVEANPAGRFPANLIVSDDALNSGVESKSIRSKRGGSIGTNNSTDKYEGGWKEMETFDCGYNDKGSFSRYYDLDAWYSQFIITPKASKSEKNKGLDHLPDKVGGGMQGTVDKSLKTGSGNERNNVMKNNHPTVKPIKLMSYLITLGSREGDVILDPFMGSGTTPLAAKNMKRKYIGIEREEEYYKICCARVGDEPTVLPNNIVVTPEPPKQKEEPKKEVVETGKVICELCNVDYTGSTREEHESRDFHKRYII